MEIVVTQISKSVLHYCGAGGALCPLDYFSVERIIKHTLWLFYKIRHQWSTLLEQTFVLRLTTFIYKWFLVWYRELVQFFLWFPVRTFDQSNPYRTLIYNFKYK